MARALPNSLHSPAQLEGLFDELAALSAWVRDGRIRSRAGMRPQPRPTLSAALEEILPEVRNAAVTESLIDQAKRRLHQLTEDSPIVNVTMVAVPDERTKQVVTGWFRREIAPNVLCRYSADRDLAGGAVVRTGSRIFDYSWRSKLLAKRDAIPKLLADVR